MVDMMKDMRPSVIDNLCSNFEDHNLIRPKMFSKYAVKRGLRNADGTGVLAGITCVSNVHGYMVNEGEVEPIEGRLTYRGHNLYDLLDGFDAEDRFGFPETAYLLLCGALPTQEQLDDFTEMLADACSLPDNFTEDVIMRAPSRDIMNKLAVSTLALYSYDPNPDDTSLQNIVRQAVNLIAKFPVIISHAYQSKRRYYDNASMFLHMPDRNYTTAENILSLIRPDGMFTREEAMLLDRCLIIHAEHGGGNNSAFTTRVVSSSATDTYSAIAAAIGALKGPRHGGANIKVVNMFEDMKKNINTDDDNAIIHYLDELLEGRAFDRSGLIYGIGHAVYSLSDPRTRLFKKFVGSLAEEKGLQQEFELYSKVEKFAPEIISKKRKMFKGVSANIDFYSGFAYSMLDIPFELFTPLFASARIAGWSAHRMEELINAGKIIRPAYKAVCTEREYLPLPQRD